MVVSQDGAYARNAKGRRAAKWNGPVQQSARAPSCAQALLRLLQSENCMQRVLPLVAAALLAFAGSAAAQMPDYMAPPYLPPPATIVTVIRAGRLVDVDKGTVLRDQVIVVRGGTIASIES